MKPSKVLILGSSPIIASSEVMPGVYLIWLETPRIASEATPGQFVMVRCGQDCVLPRPFSIHQVDGDKLALLFNVVGKGTGWLAQLQKGDTLELFGPLGNGFSINPGSKNLLLVAGGVGIAPLCFLADEALNKKYSIKLLLGAQTAARLYPEHLLPAGIKPVMTTDDGTAGRKAMITDLLPEHVDWADQIFACGPIGMYRDMAEKHRQSPKRKPVQISLEVRMGCGLGVCYGCTIKTQSGLKQVCKDGPVFDLQEILWDGLGF